MIDLDFFLHIPVPSDKDVQKVLDKITIIKVKEVMREELKKINLQSENIQYELKLPDKEEFYNNQGKLCYALIYKARQPGWDIYDYTINCAPYEWRIIIEQSLTDIKYASDEVKKVTKETNGIFYPPLDRIYQIFHMLPPHKVKVVILAQDPYMDLSTDWAGNKIIKAQGYAFGASRDDSRLPPSLLNIFKEIQNEYGRDQFEIPSHGSLIRWIQQGVFLLNTCLTVNPGKPKSHGDIYRGFIVKVLSFIVQHNKNCIFMFWGKSAQSYAKNLPCKNDNILTSQHPSPQAVNNNKSGANSFMGNGHFVKANELLKKYGMSQIDWRII